MLKGLAKALTLIMLSHEIHDYWPQCEVKPLLNDECPCAPCESWRRFQRCRTDLLNMLED